MTRSELYLLITAAMRKARPGLLSGNAASEAQFVQWATDCRTLADELAKHHFGFDGARFMADCDWATYVPKWEPTVAEMRTDGDLLMEHANKIGKFITRARLGALGARHLSHLYTLGEAPVIEFRKLLRADLDGHPPEQGM